VNPTTSASSTDATAPGPPQQLTARVLSSSSVELRWLFATDLGGSGIAAYRVKRGGSDISGWLSASTRTYGDTSAPRNSSLTYTAEAKDGQGNISSASNSVNVTTPLESIPPSTPGSLSASGLTTTSIRVSWSAASDSGGSGLSGYKIYKAGVLISGSSPVTGNTFDHTGLYPNTTYTAYTVKAIDGAGNLSAAAGPVNGTTLPDTTAPTAPTNFHLTSSGADWMDFAWNVSTDSGGSGLAGYKVYFLGEDSFSSWESLLSGPNPVTSASYSVDTTGWTWEYYVGFRVYAVDGAGNLSLPTDWIP
jgi:hypothetical protein